MKEEKNHNHEDSEELEKKNSNEKETVKETAQEEKKLSKEESEGGLKKELEERTKFLAECNDSLLRLRAEFENFRKRNEREKTDIFRFSQEALIKELFLVIDNFELALNAAGKNKDFDNFHKGVEMIYKELKKVLEKEGVAEIKSEGEKGDPHKHEVISHDPGDGEGEEVVLEVIRKGYMLNEKVLRPAMVKVGKKPAKNEKQLEVIKEHKLTKSENTGGEEHE